MGKWLSTWVLSLLLWIPGLFSALFVFNVFIPPIATISLICLGWSIILSYTVHENNGNEIYTKGPLAWIQKIQKIDDFKRNHMIFKIGSYFWATVLAFITIIILALKIKYAYVFAFVALASYVWVLIFYNYLPVKEPEPIETPQGLQKMEEELVRAEFPPKETRQSPECDALSMMLTTPALFDETSDVAGLPAVFMFIRDTLSPASAYSFAHQA